MNLIDLISRKDKVVERGVGLPVAFVEWQGYRWRGLRVTVSDVPQLILTKIESFTEWMSCPHSVGWYAACAVAGAFVNVTLERAGRASSLRIDLGTTPVPICVPWLNGGARVGEATRVSLHFVVPDGAKVDFLVHRCLDRSHLVKLARGNGVELGPGPTPQILPGPGVDVIYVEEAPVDRWRELYGRGGLRMPAAVDFSSYVIGTAWNLPVPDASLDFIFSSHVFEHLANPLGHLLRWRNKLKPGGVILAVVPDLESTKEYEMFASSFDEIRAEHDRGIDSPERSHYLRWAKMRGAVGDVDRLMETGTSIHSHYYTPGSMARLLHECVSSHGYSSYSITQSQNHKDFHFCLWL